MTRNPNVHMAFLRLNQFFCFFFIGHGKHNTSFIRFYAKKIEHTLHCCAATCHCNTKRQIKLIAKIHPVSYTHLTLPTIA